MSPAPPQPSKRELELAEAQTFADIKWTAASAVVLYFCAWFHGVHMLCDVELGTLILAMYSASPCRIYLQALLGGRLIYESSISYQLYIIYIHSPTALKVDISMLKHKCTFNQKRVPRPIRSLNWKSMYRIQVLEAGSRQKDCEERIKCIFA